MSLPNHRGRVPQGLALLGVILIMILFTRPLGIPRDEFVSPTGHAVISHSQSVQSWALNTIRAQEAWTQVQGAGSIVAVLDTGVNPIPSLNGALLEGKSFVPQFDTPADDVGHGTYVASVIAARGNMGPGVWGVAPAAKILPVKVASRTFSPSPDTVAEAIGWAIQNRADVINMSFGLQNISVEVRIAVEEAASNGVLVVASVGNDSCFSGIVGLENVIAVAAMTRQMKVENPCPGISNVAAPGVAVIGASWDGTSPDSEDGSSASAALVSGALALLHEKFGVVSSHCVRLRLIEIDTLDIVRLLDEATCNQQPRS